MLISYYRNFIYVHLEKTGGTSIEIALRPFMSPTDIKKDVLEGKHSYVEDIKKIVGDKWDTMYKFSTVRDPHDLMISLYYYAETIMSNFMEINDENLINFFKQNDHPTIKSWEETLPYMIDYYDSYINKTFLDGFIQTILSGNGHYKMKTQIERLDDSVELFDIDNIENDWQTITNKLNIYNSKIGYKNKSKKPKEIKLSNESINMIINFFKEDYKNIPIKTGFLWKHSNMIE